MASAAGCLFDDGDSPGAAAPAAASAEAEGTLRARAAAALVGSGSSSRAPAVGAALPSDDLATWAQQVEAEFAPVHARLDDKIPRYLQPLLPPAR